MKECIRLLSVPAVLAVMYALAAPAGWADVGARTVTVDFSDVGFGNVFEPDFYRSEGIVFPTDNCGAAGCDAWFIGWVQGDDALVQAAPAGRIEGSFSRPVSAVSLRVAPALQGTAAYSLKAYGQGGRLLGVTSITVTQDFDDPENTGFGYFRIGLEDLSGPAKSFVLESEFIRSSFEFITEIPYAVSSISYVHWGSGGEV